MLNFVRTLGRKESAEKPPRLSSQYLNIKKMFNEHLHICEAEISSDEIIKSINSETNNKSPGNNRLRAHFSKHFLNELAHVLLGVYNS